MASGLAADHGDSVVQIAFYCMEASARHSGNQAVIGQGVSARQLSFLTLTRSSGSEVQSNSLVFGASAQAVLDCATSTEPVLKTHQNVD